MRKLALVWGVYPVLSVKSESTDEVIDMSIHSAMLKGYVKEGDLNSYYCRNPSRRFRNYKS